MRNAIKVSQCDAQGKFSFEKAQKGAWLVLTRVRWSVGNAFQGGTLLREVTLLENQTTRRCSPIRTFLLRKKFNLRRFPNRKRNLMSVNCRPETVL